MPKPRYDIGVIVALQEELEYVIEVAPLVESLACGGTHFHVLDFGPFKAIASLVGQMGPLPAMHATQRLLEYADIGLLVMLGTAGALDDDLFVGDVAVATEINEYQANSRAETAEGGYEFRYSGRHWPLEYRIREALNNFEFSARTSYQAWRDRAARMYDGLPVRDKGEICTPPPKFHRGNIASGNVVAASKAFAAEIKQVDRKFIAIDMEAAGFAYAATERVHRIPHLVIRGISDGADENKKKLDKSSKNAWRRYCVTNAATLLQALLQWEGFQEAVGLAVAADGGQPRPDVIRRLIEAVRHSPGGAWAAGVALGVYSHGPLVVASGNAVPVDVNRLRASDARFRSMIESIEGRVEPSGTFSVEVAAEAVVRAVKRYREGLSNSAADALIADFDAVVVEIVCAGDQTDDAQTPVLAEAERLDEDAGAQAVVGFLKDRIGTGPRIRERYFSALADIGAEVSIVELAQSLGPPNLTRGELEHAMFACPGQDRKDLAEQLWKRHEAEFGDPAAILTRQEFARRFPSFRASGT
ncbi:5'-methylthioadenosine/S-adenosylhomocysteine nucleosidase [Bradyrhizobium sp. AUGA SZCCT0160]|uniref:5'-methylthioadenosine/S-adenosylhomocysteine nucleosidase family protein n=1 Tax=Bradyrhizobium sp. AUGA SZCCT0160 TaxID=2807662 RepID=UPI0020110627|nr:5'-methylthioadenosine/S-adenosylhomocysteine nucleosidase [Bradyrhizobium sp. AUGA SZCCT0160]